MSSTSFTKWITTFLSEKELELDYVVACKDGKITQIGNIVQTMCVSPSDEQAAIKKVLIKIDFMNGDVMHFFNHMAKAESAKYFEDVASSAFFGQ